MTTRIWKSRCATADRLVAITDDIVLVANAGVHLLPLLQARLEQGMLPDLVPGARIVMVSFSEISQVRFSQGSRDLDIIYCNALGRQSLNVAFETGAARDQFYQQLRPCLPMLEQQERQFGPLRVACLPLLMLAVSTLLAALVWLPGSSAARLVESGLLESGLVENGVVPLAALRDGTDAQLLGLFAVLASAVAVALLVRRLRHPPVRVCLQRPARARQWFLL